MESQHPIIFLDVDGVISNSRCVLYNFNPLDDFIFDDTEKELLPLEKRCVQLLKDLIIETGAKIVISSTWREEPTHFLYLKRIFDGDIIGSTLSLNDRGSEIAEWIERHNVVSYVIFEDSAAHHETINQAGLGNHLIKTLMSSEQGKYEEEGLTTNHCIVAKEMILQR